MWHLFVQLKAQNKDYLKVFTDTIWEDKNIIVKAYPMQKEDSGVKQVNGGLMKNTRRILIMYTQQNYFTRLSLSIAIFSHLKQKQKQKNPGVFARFERSFLCVLFRALD